MQSSTSGPRAVPFTGGLRSRTPVLGGCQLVHGVWEESTVQRDPKSGRRTYKIIHLYTSSNLSSPFALSHRAASSSWLPHSLCENMCQWHSTGIMTALGVGRWVGCCPPGFTLCLPYSKVCTLPTLLLLWLQALLVPWSKLLGCKAEATLPKYVLAGSSQGKNRHCTYRSDSS